MFMILDWIIELLKINTNLIIRNKRFKGITIRKLNFYNRWSILNIIKNHIKNIIKKSWTLDRKYYNENRKIFFKWRNWFS